MMLMLLLLLPVPFFKGIYLNHNIFITIILLLQDLTWQICLFSPSSLRGAKQDFPHIFFHTNHKQCLPICLCKILYAEWVGEGIILREIISCETHIVIVSYNWITRDVIAWSTTISMNVFPSGMRLGYIKNMYTFRFWQYEFRVFNQMWNYSVSREDMESISLTLCLENMNPNQAQGEQSMFLQEDRKPQI